MSHLQCPSAWVDQNHWQELEWLNTNPGSELLSSVYVNINHWQEQLNTHPESQFLSTVFSKQDHWQEWSRLTSWLYSECNSLWLPDSHHWLTFLQAHSLAVFLNLNAFYKSNHSGPVSSIISSGLSLFGIQKRESSLIIFTGLLKSFFKFACMNFLLSYDDANSTTHLHGEHLLEHQQPERWPGQLCWIV